MGSGRCEEVHIGIQMWLPMKKTETQADKFKQAACGLDCDPNEAKLEDKLRKVVKPEPFTDKPE